ncbi:MAG: energy-coupling factor transporter transmembrane component T, partial [Ornithinibacter sp.]
MTHSLPRTVHPGAWWGWAISMAVAVSMTTNPFLLLLALAVTALVVARRRGSSPWARAFRLYLWLGLAIIVVRVVLHVVVGLKFGTIVVLPLPEVTLPSWAAGIQLGGTVYLEGLLGAAVLGMRLAVMIACIGAANALANPKRLLRALPGALHEIGSAVVVSVSVAPQLAESVLRVRRARFLRGDTSRGLRAVPAIALPVLEDTLERSLLLAAAMDSRGYGRAPAVSPVQRLLTGAATLGGLLACAIGVYGVLDATTPALMGTPTLVLGLALSGLGLWLGGRHVPRSTYRPDPWRGAEWLTVACGVIAAAALVVTARTQPDALAMPLTPLAVPALPLLAVAGLLVA